MGRIPKDSPRRIESPAQEG